jgi:predicted acyl esterase
MSSLAILATVSLFALPATPGLADGPFPINADNASADSTVTSSIDGVTTLRVRVLAPTTTPPSGGWPAVIYMTGSSTSRCNNINYYPRDQLARDGFVVVSFTGRGWPGGGVNSAACLDSSAEMADTLNDSGWDGSGPNDKQDVKDIISWVISNQPVNAAKIGVMGASYNGQRTYLMPAFDSRIAAIVPIDAPTLGLGNVASISDHASAENSSGSLFSYLNANAGWFGHSDPSVLSNVSEATRTRYLGLTVPTATQTWFNSRTVLDDNSSVDKAHLITVPTFVVHGLLDNTINPSQAIEAWKKIPAGQKYLYLGACGHGAPCATGNATALRNKIHDFLDKYLRGSAVTMGGPVFYAIPQVNQASDDWPVQQASNWPPPELPGSPQTLYLRTGNSLSTTAPTTNEAADTMPNNTWANSIGDACAATSYGAGEYVAYTSTDVALQNLKLAQVDADLTLSSSTTRLAVVADLWEVTSTGVDVARVWKGTSFVVPTARGQAANTHVRFKFVPSGNAYTVAAGNKLRLKIATNYRGYFAPEPYPGTYSIYHTNTEPSKITLHWAS